MRVANARMESALRRVSVERGHDPRTFTLLAFGGAGPLHACALAIALGIRQVLVPAVPGALSALGILDADLRREFSRTVMATPGYPQITRVFREFEAEARDVSPRRSCSLPDARCRSPLPGPGIRTARGLDSECRREIPRLHARSYGYADERAPWRSSRFACRPLRAPASRTPTGARKSCAAMRSRLASARIASSKKADGGAPPSTIVRGCGRRQLQRSGRHHRTERYNLSSARMDRRRGPIRQSRPCASTRRRGGRR